MPGDGQQQREGAGLPAEVLTVRMARGDEAAWGAFHEQYFSRLLGYLLVLHGGDEELARDSLQQTYMRVVRHVRRIDDEEMWWSWLTRVARSAAIDGSRKSKRYAALMENVAHAMELEQQQQNEPGPMELIIEECLACWRADDRGMLEKKYFEQWSYADLAEEFSTTPKAIESRLARLRARLKECILERLHHA